MQILFAVIAIFWWIAIWGLNDILVENWSREEKFYLYVSMLGFIAVVICLFPEIIRRF
jgi:hypothetical protein